MLRLQESESLVYPPRAGVGSSNLQGCGPRQAACSARKRPQCPTCEPAHSARFLCYNLFFCAQVNRYAGAETKDGAEGGAKKLYVKGLEVDRRDVPPFVRAVCRGVLEEALVRGSVDGALRVCRAEIQRLLAGNVSLGDLVLSGVSLMW